MGTTPQAGRPQAAQAVSESDNAAASLSSLLAAAARSQTSASAGALGIARHTSQPPAASPAASYQDAAALHNGLSVTDTCLRTSDPAGTTGMTLPVSPPPAALAALPTIAIDCDAEGTHQATRQLTEREGRHGATRGGGAGRRHARREVEAPAERQREAIGQ